MGYENATYINELVATNPVHADDRESEGYLHIGNIKTALKNTFPNLTAPLTATQTDLNAWAGLTATASELNTMDGITATVTELNYCDGVTSNIQEQLDSKAEGFTISVITTNTTAVVLRHYVFRGTSLTNLYMPGSTLNPTPAPAAGDRIRVSNAASDDDSIVARFSPLLCLGEGTSDSIGRGESREYVYIDSTTQWIRKGA